MQQRIIATPICCSTCVKWLIGGFRFDVLGKGCGSFDNSECVCSLEWGPLGQLSRNVGQEKVGRLKLMAKVKCRSRSQAGPVVVITL